MSAWSSPGTFSDTVEGHAVAGSTGCRMTKSPFRAPRAPVRLEIETVSAGSMIASKREGDAMHPVLRRGARVAAGMLGAYFLAIRPAVKRWGASGEEVAAALPGDGIVAGAQSSSTRAITVRAPVDLVFPWLAQIGQGRGGFYSYDLLENLSGLDIHSANRILPQFQDLKRGDGIPMAPGPEFYGFIVAEVATPERLVLELCIHPFTGQQVGSAPSRGPWLHASWAFALVPVGERSTRLITRTRLRVRMPFGLGGPYRVVLELVEFIMERRMLLGLRERAEAAAPSAFAGAP